jgi:hypothetical protein
MYIICTSISAFYGYGHQAYITSVSSSAAVAEQTKAPLFGRTVFTGRSRGSNPVTAKIRYSFRKFQLVAYVLTKLKKGKSPPPQFCGYNLKMYS